MALKMLLNSDCAPVIYSAKPQYKAVRATYNFCSSYQLCHCSASVVCSMCNV